MFVFAIAYLNDLGMKSFVPTLCKFEPNEGQFRLTLTFDKLK